MTKMRFSVRGSAFLIYLLLIIGYDLWYNRYYFKGAFEQYMKKWTIKNPDPQVIRTLSQYGGLTPLCAGVLAARGYDTMEKAAGFFNQGPDGEEITALSDPMLIKDMREAAEILLKAVEDGRKICVYGDYDCDGVTATALLYTYLQFQGGDVVYHINDRDSEGYGMFSGAVRKLADDGVQVIVTVDNGISAIKEAELAAELGMELIITDHHQPGEELPKAAAVVDPHRKDDVSPFKYLCGCGVALKLIAAMEGDYSMAMEQFSDLAAIATVADVVSLTGENREIVRTGMRYLKNTENPGLKALIEAAGIKNISSTAIAFYIAPRINAAGRMDTALKALELFLCDDPEEARELAKEVNDLNVQRQAQENEILENIKNMILKDPSMLHQRVLFVYGHGWSHGIIGIVASKLEERFGKPVFILSDDGEEFAKGSARAPEGFSVYEALAACADVLTKFGGHKGAGGFSLLKENVQAFGDALQKHAAENYPVMPVMTLNADKVITPEELTVDNVSSLSILEPCGTDNPSPCFAMLSAVIENIIPLSDGKHTKLSLKYGNSSVTGLLFGTETASFPYRAGDVLNLLVSPEINEFNGRTSVNVRILDYRINGINQQKYFNAKETYESFKRGENIAPAVLKRMLPDRGELGNVYRQIAAKQKASFDVIFGAVCSDSMNYCKFRIALDAFSELGLIKTDIYSEIIEIIPTNQKADLENSAILSRLKRLISAPAAV